MPNASGARAAALRRSLLLLAALALLSVSGGCQGMFVYHPVRAPEAELLLLAADLGLEPWPQPGESRMGWRAPAPARNGRADAAREPAPNRALVFHGNAGHSLQRTYLARGLQSVASASWEVYLLEYPGFGSRPGSPDEHALVEAGVAAVDALIDHDPSRPVYLVGESIGTGVACAVAAARPEAIPGVLLVTPFTNLLDVGSVIAPRFLVRLVLRDQYDNERALASYRGRVAVLLAGRDRVTPAVLGRRLYDGYEGPKRLWLQERAGHNTLDLSPASPWWAEVSDFLTGAGTR